MKLLKVKLFLLLLFTFSSASHQIQTLQPPVRRGRKPRVGFHFSQICTASITAPTWDSNSQDVAITTKVTCNKQVLYDKTQPLSELKETMIAQGIWLFKKSRAGGAAYLLFENALTFQLENSEFKNLPPFPGVETAAPVIIDGSMGWVTDSTFTGNKGFEMAGALYATSTPTTRAKVQLFDSTVSDNSAEGAGAMTAQAHAEVTASDCEFSRNFGKQAGVIHVQDFAAADLEGCTLEGVGVSDNFTRYLRGEGDIHEEVARAGALLSEDYARVELQNCTFTGHAGTQGTVMALEDTSLYMEDTIFRSNAAEMGGAVYMEGKYGNSGKSFWTTFEKNIARHGGALTVFGDGVFTIYMSEFHGNSALNGGAVFSGHSSAAAMNGDDCADPSQGSRISANYSSFATNSAKVSGGAVFSRCAQVLLQNATFESNDAGEHGGGIFLDTGYQLDAPGCSFTNNSAMVSGGAIFASTTDLIELENGLLHSNSAGDGGGGAIYTTGVQDVHLSKTNVSWNKAKGSGGALALSEGVLLRIENGTVHNNEAGVSGGAIFAQNVEQARVRSTNLTENTATTGDGGSVCAQSSGSLDLEDVQMIENVARGSGGAVASRVADTVTISKVFASNNTAQNEDGGAILLDQTETISVVNTPVTSTAQPSRRLRADLGDDSETLVLVNNTAGGMGGGLVISQSTNAVLSRTKLHNNKGATGGAFAALSVQELNISHSSFESNNASTGGAVSLENSGLVAVNNAQLTRNYAKGNGGAISASDVAKLVLSDLEVEKNLAGAGAGLQIDGQTNLLGTTVTLQDNEAREDGGGIACRNSSKIDMSASVFTYNYAPDASSISAACNCNVTAVKCAFVRDKKRNGNGDFFQSARHCSWINAKGCSFVGGPWRISLFWLLLILGTASVVIAIGAGFMRFCVVAAVRNKKKEQEEALLTEGTTSSSSSSSSSGSYSSSYDEDDDEDKKQVVIDVPGEEQAGPSQSSASQSRKRAIAKPGIEHSGGDGSISVKPKMEILPDGSGVSLSLLTSPTDAV